MDTIELKNISDADYLITIDKQKLQLLNEYVISEANKEFDIYSVNGNLIESYEKLIENVAIGYGLDDYYTKHLIRDKNAFEISRQYYRELEKGKINLKQYINMTYEFLYRTLPGKYLVYIKDKYYVVCDGNDYDAQSLLTKLISDKDLSNTTYLQGYIDYSNGRKLQK